MIHHKWTEKEHTVFVSAARQFGKDYRAIAKKVKSKNRIQVQGHSDWLCQAIIANPKRQDADLLNVLKHPLITHNKWTAADNEKLLMGLRNNVKLLQWIPEVQKLIKTKTCF